LHALKEAGIRRTRQRFRQSRAIGLMETQF